MEMHMKAFLLTGLLATTALVAAQANAQAVEQGQWAVSGSVGAEYNTSGDLHGGTTTGAIPLGVIASLRDAGAPALPAAVTATGNAAQLRIGSRSYDDVYGTGFNVGFEATYGLGSGREVFGEFGYSKADQSSLQVGDAAVINGATDVAVVPVFGTFGDYKSYSFVGGLRQWFNEGGTWQPYIAGRLGVVKVDKINASFSVPALTINSALNNLPFYEDSTVVNMGADVGVSYNLTENLSLVGEVGIRYSGKLKGDDAAIGGLGLASINDSSERTYVPVSIKLRSKF
jgi:hypothetical protein